MPASRFRGWRFCRRLSRTAKAVITKPISELRMFNIRLQLEAVRMKPEQRQALQDELHAIRMEMDGRLAQLNQRKAEIIAEKTAPEREAMQQRIAAYADELRGELQGRLRDDIAKDDKDLQQGPEAFGKVLEVIDKRLDKIKEGNDKIAGEIRHDIQNCR